MGNLALVQVELGGIEAGDAVDPESIHFAGDIRDLEVSDEAPAEQRDAAGIREDVGDVAERAELCRAVVDRVARRKRVLDSEIVAQKAARQEVVDIAARALDHHARFDSTEAAAVDAGLALVVKHSVMRLEVDDP